MRTNELMISCKRKLSTRSRGGLACAGSRRVGRRQRDLIARANTHVVGVSTASHPVSRRVRAYENIILETKTRRR